MEKINANSKNNDIILSSLISLLGCFVPNLKVIKYLLVSFWSGSNAPADSPIGLLTGLMLPHPLNQTALEFIYLTLAQGFIILRIRTLVVISRVHNYNWIVRIEVGVALP